MRRFENVIAEPHDATFGPYKVYRQTTGRLVVCDRRRRMGDWILDWFESDELELAREDARQRATAEGVADKDWP